MNKYLHIKLSYKFSSISSNTYEQNHYMEVSPEKDISRVKFDTLLMLTQLFTKLVEIESINIDEISELEYLAGRSEEDANLRFLQQQTVE
ncbi:hypothetical protein [Bacillus sp. UNC322MFChir4.1]|uniref:hypothetical protein n=1 Tax=Bacillus sp. UNC322MFChir4.1 TaxID=1449045 RepID=UPI0005534875|nr:hypothetical protein [Bacillus sp. UNC322MFChir4.1]